MTDAPAAFQATFCGFRSVGSRKMTALTLEVPVEHSERVLKVLGHPDPLNPKWFAIALLDEKAAAQAQGASAPVNNQSSPVNTREKRNWNELPPATQAGIRCSEPAFQKFVSDDGKFPEYEGEEGAALFVRQYCGVFSRAEIVDGTPAGVEWRTLSNKYDAWMRAGV